MYGLCQCSLCHRPRIVDESQDTSACPHCSYVEKVKDLTFFYESRDQGAVRDALSQATGFVAPDTSEERKAIAESDPYSTMIYRYEHTSDLDEKMEILAKGLTAIQGSFTLEDVEEIVGKRAEKMVSAMLDRCMISEFKLGRYRA